MNKSKHLYVVSEADIAERLVMISAEIQIIRELIKDNIIEPLLEEETFIEICEHYTTLYRVEALLYNIIDESYYDKKDYTYHLSEKQKTHLVVFLQSLYATKEILQEQNISLYLH